MCNEILQFAHAVANNETNLLWRGAPVTIVDTDTSPLPDGLLVDESVRAWASEVIGPYSCGSTPKFFTANDEPQAFYDLAWWKYVTDHKCATDPRRRYCASSKKIARYCHDCVWYYHKVTGETPHWVSTRNNASLAVPHGPKDYNRAVGVETELAGLRSPWGLLELGREGWLALKDDCSIRRSDRAQTGTVEAVIGAASGHTLMARLQRLARVFRRDGAIANNSCGGHVHVDARDLSTRDAYRVFVLWNYLEGTYLRKLCSHRTRSVYCRPLSRHVHLSPEPSLVGAYSAPSIRSSYRHVFDTNVDRYVTLNVDAHEKYGSLEFRCFPAAVSYERLVVNALTAARLVSFAKNERRSSALIRKLQSREIGRNDATAYIWGSHLYSRASALPAVGTETCNDYDCSYCDDNDECDDWAVLGERRSSYCGGGKF